MSTQRENILAALLGLCNGAGGATAYRSREAAFSRSEGVSVLVVPSEEIVENQTQRLTVRDFSVLITVIARGTVPDQVADPVVQAVHAAIAADQTLGGRVARIIEEQTKFDFEVADKNSVAAELRFRFRYMTPVEDITRLA